MVVRTGPTTAADTGALTAEAALHESEARFHALVMASADVIYRMSPDWSEMRQLEGRRFRSDTFIPSDAWLERYVHPDDRALVMAAIREAVRTKHTFELEHRVVRADGTLGWTFSRAVPILGPDGAIVEWVGAATDVSARKQADGALRESEARLRLALDVAELGTWSIDLLDGSGHLDERAARITGLPAGAFADVIAAQLAGTHPDDLAPMREAFAAGVASGEPFELAYRVVHADGSIHHVASRARVVTDDAGRPVRVVGTNRDVTVERVAAERGRLLQALTAAFGAAATPEAVVRVVLEHAVPAFGAATGVLLLRTPDGTALTSAGALGYGDLLGDLLVRVPLDASLASTAAAREERPVWVEDRESGVAAYPAIARVYDEIGCQASAVLPLTDRAGEVVGVLVFNFRTARRFDADTRALFEAVAAQCAQALERARLFAAERAARREAEAAYAEAARANRAKSEFLAVMSHELRTPLNAIGGYAELMEMGIRGTITPEQREDLRRLQASQRHLLGLINEVLNYARLETGTVHYDLTTLRVRDALAGAEALVAPQTAAKGLALTVVDCAPDIVVRADAEKLRQILVNLLSNAVKFTDRGGCIELACVDARERVHVTVRDTGIGIARDQLERIFDPFVQVRSDLTRTAEGTGLGLAISRDLARGMGGDLTVESTPGAGSVFTLVLPRP